VGFSSPLPCPQTARPSGYKGARNAREPATNPCSATGASGSNLRSFASHAKVGKARANEKSGREGGTIGGTNNPDMCKRFPLPKTRASFPVIVSGADQTGISLRHGAPTRNKVWRRPRGPHPTMPQADRFSRFLALI
jgi:hypothetical protein